MSKLRIQKYLSEQGVASRRAVEEMILEGRITVNGKPVAQLPCFVEPGEDDIRIDGDVVARRSAKKVYYLLNKPRGVVCTVGGPGGQPTAAELLPRSAGRLLCAGRLDEESTGVVILTNDGELTQLLTHPRYGVPKTYLLEIEGRLNEEQMAALKAGMWLDRRHTHAAQVKVLRSNVRSSLLEMEVVDDRNREIPRIMARLGHRVRKMKRIAIGLITERGLKVGRFRTLTAPEVAKLKKSGSGETRIEAPRLEKSVAVEKVEAAVVPKKPRVGEIKGEVIRPKKRVIGQAKAEAARPKRTGGGDKKTPRRERTAPRRGAERQRGRKGPRS